MRCLILHSRAEGAAHLSPFFTSLGPCHATHPGGEWDALIRWGNEAGPEAPFTLNPADAIRRIAESPDQTDRIMQANRLPYQRGLDDRHPYRVHAVDLQVIAITRRDRAGRFRIAPRVPRRRRALLEHLARRTLYLNGLHFGAVDIVVRRSGKATVTAIDPAPSLAGNALALYAEALSATVRTLHAEAQTHPLLRSSQIMLGADPEFLLVHRRSRRLRYASDYFPPRGPIGYDARTVRSRRGRLHPIAEVHPNPTPHPHELISDIRRSLAYANRLAPDPGTRWLAGACPHPRYPTGGHIHFSRLPLTTNLLRALDNYLAIPLLLLEEPRSASRRRRRHGYLGDFRRKEHGGFEYRTLPSWITSANRARATLFLAKLVALEYPRLRSHYLSTPESQQAFYWSDKEYFRPLFPQLWAEITATPSYERFQRELLPIAEWVEARRRWREDGDLRRRWGIELRW